MAGTFVSLQNRDFRTLWFGSVFSFMGVQMQFFLRGILAWDLTEREGALGLVYFVFGVALLISTPLGGVATDRFPKRTVMLIGQAALMFSAIGMGLAVITGVVQFWMLLVASVIQGTSFGFFGPARVAMSTELVGRDQLGNAISLSSIAMNGSRVFAPSLAGVLAGWQLFGIGGAYLVASAVAILSFLLTVPLPNLIPTAVVSRNPFVEISNGMKYVAQHGPIRRIVLMSTVVLMFAFSYVSFTPALVEGVFGLGDAAVGLLSTFVSIGAVVAGLLVARFADSPAAKAIMVVGGLVFTTMVIGLGIAPAYWITLGLSALIGAGSTTFQTISNTLALRDADDAFQGRVQSILQLGFAGFGMAALPLGLLAESIGLQNTLVFMGSAASFAVLAYAAREQTIGAAAEEPQTASVGAGEPGA